MTTKFDLILAIVDAEQHDIIIQACEKVKATAYMVFTVRGNIGRKNFRLLSVEVESPKEIIMIVTPQSQTAIVKEQIIKDADLDNPDNGLLIVLDVKDLGGFSYLLQAAEID